MAINIRDDYDEAYSRMIGDALRGSWQDDTLLSNFTHLSTEHSGPIRNVATESPLDQPMAPVDYTSDFEVDTLRNTDVDRHTVFVHSLAKAGLDAVAPGIYRALTEVTDAIGNSVDANGRSFYDAQVDAIERMDISFDEDGHPSGLKMYVNPETADQISKLPPRTPEQILRLEETLARKKEEFLAKKRSRRLS